MLVNTITNEVWRAKNCKRCYPLRCLSGYTIGPVPSRLGFTGWRHWGGCPVSLVHTWISARAWGVSSVNAYLRNLLHWTPWSGVSLSSMLLVISCQSSTAASCPRMQPSHKQPVFRSSGCSSITLSFLWDTRFPTWGRKLHYEICSTSWSSIYIAWNNICCSCLYCIVFFFFFLS